MKLCTGKYFLLCCSVFLAGCSIGNGRICGPQTAPAYCDEETFNKLLYPKPYLTLWEKEAASEQERRDDSKDCGGQASDISPMRNYDEENYQLDGETIWDTRKRLAHNWQRCMIEKGYLFKGACYDNEISRESPACEGRVLTPLQQ